MERYFEINESGHNIRCKLYCREPRAVRRAVIFAHGFGGHKDNSAAAKFAEKLLSKYKNTALITFDLPCHGGDVKKKLCLQDCGTYLSLVIKTAKERFQAEELYACATSFGGYLTLKYIYENGSPFRRIALRCPAVNLYDALTGTIMSPEELEKIQKGKDTLIGFDRKVPVSLRFLQEIRENDIQKYDFLDWAEDILILHGTEDEIIPFETVNTFAENNLMEFIPVEGADHRFRNPLKMDLAIKHILEFYGF